MCSKNCSYCENAKKNGGGWEVRLGAVGRGRGPLEARLILVGDVG